MGQVHSDLELNFGDKLGGPVLREEQKYRRKADLYMHSSEK